MRRLGIGVAACLMLTACSSSSSDVVGDLAGAWEDRDVDAVAEMASAELALGQREVLADAMSRCTVGDGDVADVPGGVSDDVRAWGVRVACDGEERLLAGYVANLTEDDRWEIDPANLPGGEHSDFVPSALPAELRALPKVGVEEG